MPAQFTQVEKTCERCGARFTVVRSQAAKRRFCSPACWYKTNRTSEPEAWFWEHTVKADGCWLWTGYINRAGYGELKVCGASVMAHRYSYTLLVGPIPQGLHLDHVKARGCVNRNCVNPAHLEPVTPKVNAHRSDAPGIVLHRANHCHMGHAFTPKNTYVRPNGTRQCLACVEIRRAQKRRAA